MSNTTLYYLTAQRETRQLWESLHNLKEMQSQWNALDYGSTLPAGPDGLTSSDIGAAIFATTDAMFSLLAQGHATNLAKLL